VQCGAVWCSVVQCGAVWCSVVQCVAVCCSVLQCVAVYRGVTEYLLTYVRARVCVIVFVCLCVSDYGFRVSGLRFRV